MTETIPTPGKPVRGSKSGKPIMALFDLLGRRWAMGVIWVLSGKGPCTFRELQTACESISPTVLNTRLKELRAAGLVTHGDAGYQVTSQGRELIALLQPIAGWSESWAGELVSNP